MSRKFRYGFWDFMEDYGVMIITAVLVVFIIIAQLIGSAIIEAAKYKCP